MESEAHRDMAHFEFQEGRASDAAEETSATEKCFLKDLCEFMKNRDTPIERIPNLGFKQIDLFLMFKIVRDLGGYHQVTGQQLWKQVYNRLGGNPRSTSAATCTRRHYERLLLPYEFHLKGLPVNTFPYQFKHCHLSDNSYYRDDGQVPAKRRLLSVSLHQNPCLLQPDQHGSAFHTPHHYPHYYHQNHKILPPHVPVSSSVLTPQLPSGPQSQFSLEPCYLNPTESIKEPLEQLRYLAEQYKSSSGLSEPLNLSIKSLRQETNSNPSSSFSLPPSNKNPKFLNKPSPLYSPHCAKVERNERCEMEDGEASTGSAPHSFPVKDHEAYFVDIRATMASSNNAVPSLQVVNGADTTAQKPSSPKTDFILQVKEKKEGSADISALELSHLLPSLPRQNEKGEMEIEVPLSVFHNWLKLCRSSATKQEQKQPPNTPAAEEHSGQRKWSDPDVLPTNLMIHMNPQHRSSLTQDPRLSQRNLPTPPSVIHTTNACESTSQNPFISYQTLPSGGVPKNAAVQDVYLLDQQNTPKHPNNQNAHDQEIPFQMKMNTNPIPLQKDTDTNKYYCGGMVRRGMDNLAMAPSTALMLNSSSTTLLQLTTEELMKLKKMISSS